jgi:CelD/BcsL family acetyltransferase involved in cellulose biosynthesis
MTLAGGSARRATAPSAAGGQGVAHTRELSPPRPAIAFGPGCHSIMTLDGFCALEAIWRELSAHSGVSTAFQSWDFAVEWLNQFVIGRAGSATGRFRVLVACEVRTGIIGIAPLFEEHSLGQSRFGTTLQPFGRSHSMETLTDEPMAIFRQGHEQLATRLLMARIAVDSRDKGWDIAVVYGSRSNRTPDRASLAVSKWLDSIEVTRQRELPMTLALPTSWRSFESRLSKSMRDNLAYYPRRLKREVGSWQIQTARSPAEVAMATEDLIRLHRKRSESKVGLSHRNHLPSDRETLFLRGWFQRLARRGEISIVCLKVGGTTLAAQAFVEAGRCLSVYYSGYDERWRQYSPLTIITAEVIRRAIARGFERVEFPPGESAWKSRWGAIAVGTIEEKSSYAVRLSALFRGLARRLIQRQA